MFETKQLDRKHLTQGSRGRIGCVSCRVHFSSLPPCWWWSIRPSCWPM